MKTRLNILEERVLSFQFNDDVILGTVAHVEEGQYSITIAAQAYI